MDRKLLKAIKKFIKESEDDFYYPHSHEVSMMVGTTRCCQGFETEITINFNVDPNITTKIQVYPNTIQIDLGCTYKPLVYNSSTIYHLMEHLSKISYHITQLSGHTLPKVSDWIITHYHLNKDGTLALNGQSFNFEFEEVSNGLIRFYTKNFEDNTRARLEQINTPQIPLSEMLEGIIEK